MDREEAHVKLKSGTGHQWWLVLIDCSVIPLCDFKPLVGFYARGTVELNFFKKV